MTIPQPFSFPPVKQRVHRKRLPRSRETAPVGPLTLVSATYESTACVDLTFDRPIDASAFVPSTLIVYDGDIGVYYGGTSDITMLSPVSVRIIVNGIADWFDPGVVLNVTAGNGIVAVGDSRRVGRRGRD